MSRILLADDSPHAQRMGERILREEGYEVVTVTDGQAALSRMQDVDPDVVFADVSLPRKSGYEICQAIKENPRHKHVRVLLTAGLLEPFDDSRAREVKCDGILKKPFESSVVLQTIKPLIDAAQKERVEATQGGVIAMAPPEPQSALPTAGVKPPEPSTPSPARPLMQRSRLPTPPSSPIPQAVPVRVVSELQESEVVALNGNLQADTERVRAAVTVALDAAMPALVDEITKKVLIALGH